MIDNRTIEEIKKSPIKEKIEIIERILDSVKGDLLADERKRAGKSFRVRRFSMGEEVSVDRDKIFAERGL